MKSNYGLSGAAIKMTWVGGYFVRDPDDANHIDRNGAIIDKSQMAADMSLKLLRKFDRENRNVPANPGVSFAPSVFVQHPEADGLKKHQFKKAMEQLLSDGTIKQIMEGPPSKRRARLLVSADHPGETSDDP